MPIAPTILLSRRNRTALAGLPLRRSGVRTVIYPARRSTCPTVGRRFGYNGSDGFARCFGRLRFAALVAGCAGRLRGAAARSERARPRDLGGPARPISKAGARPAYGPPGCGPLRPLADWRIWPTTEVKRDNGACRQTGFFRFLAALLIIVLLTLALEQGRRARRRSWGVRLLRELRVWDGRVRASHVLGPRSASR